MKINKLFGHKTLRCTNTAASSRERRTKANFVSGHNLHEQDFALHLCNLCNPLLLILFCSSWKISYQSLHRHKAPPCSTSSWILVDSGTFRSFQSISMSFGWYTNSSRYWNQTWSTHLVTAPVTWRNASHHSSLLFLLLQFFCAFHPLQLSF